METPSRNVANYAEVSLSEVRMVVPDVQFPSLVAQMAIFNTSAPRWLTRHVSNRTTQDMFDTVRSMKPHLQYRYLGLGIE